MYKYIYLYIIIYIGLYAYIDILIHIPKQIRVINSIIT